jgi:YHS domain-containing protein
MTAARQKRKRYRVWLVAAAGFVLALHAGVAVSPAAVTERIVVDWHTGLAIGGYDPVAYFTDGKQKPGSADFELHYGGVIWRFCNLGNREAFAARPDVYMPQFGGYDPLGVARGVAVAGKPNVWLISGERLFLFYDQAWLETFAADPDRLTAQAARKWPSVLNTLSP